MISEKRSQAARANGARSRGPVTPEGKAISARNAMRHGLLAVTVVLSNEEKPVFKELFDLYVERFSPVDDVEMSMIEEMVAACWRLRRAMAIENDLFEIGIQKRPGIDSMVQTTEAYCDPLHRDDFNRIERYQARLQNIYQRSLRGLALLRKLPKQDTAPVEPEPVSPLPNEPKEPNVCIAEDAPPDPPALPGPLSGSRPRIVTLPDPVNHDSGVLVLPG